MNDRGTAMIRMRKLIRSLSLEGLRRRRFRARHLLLAALLASQSAHGVDLDAVRGDLEAGRIDQAVAVLEPIADDDPEAAFMLGRVRMLQREWEGAGDLFEGAVDLGRDTAETNLWLGRARVNQAQEASIFSKMSIARTSLRAFRRAVELDPAYAEARRSLIDYLVGAPGIAGGDVDEAREHAAILEQQDPWLGVQARASILRAEDEDADIIPMYEAAAVEMPDRFEAQFTLALLYMAAERYDDVESALIRSDTLQPGAPSVMYQYGKLAAVAGLGTERGVAALQAYMQIPHAPDDPPNAWAEYRLGSIFHREGDAAAARAAFERALVLDPDHEQASAALRQLARGR